MEEFERDLEQLELAKPPKWLKARAMMGAEEALRQSARRSRIKNSIIAVCAAGISIVFVGAYMANILGSGPGQSSGMFSSMGKQIRSMGAPAPAGLPPQNGNISNHRPHTPPRNPPDRPGVTQEKPPEKKTEPSEKDGKDEKPPEDEKKKRKKKSALSRKKPVPDKES